MVQNAKARLGDRLLQRGLVTQDQLTVALSEQRRAYRPLGEILVSLGFVRTEDVAALLAEDLGLAMLRAADAFASGTGTVGDPSSVTRPHTVSPDLGTTTASIPVVCAPALTTTGVAVASLAAAFHHCGTYDPPLAPKDTLKFPAASHPTV